MEKKSFLRPTAASKQKADILHGTVQRDHESLVLPLSVIKLTRNIRVDEDEDRIKGLAASIDQNGLINPITVRKTEGGEFELVAGFRRYHALKILGRKEAAVRIKNITEDQAALLKLAENIDRSELTGWEVCKAVYGLLPMCGGSQSRVAELIKRNRSYVSRCVSVVEAKPDVSRVKHLALRELFELFAKRRDSAGERRPSGPIPGGHAVDRVIRFNERRGGRGFTLRVHFDFDKSSAGDRERLLDHLRELIKKLESKGG
jgi:ParB family chromosome partitioning protein